ncbi:MAG: Rieske 2Fe-2S domain-containing protein [Chloroflexi bacterium]|nr:Rieske 2Fe-2S domain-containing protein [Chloroflexota bacterium]
MPALQLARPLPARRGGQSRSPGRRAPEVRRYPGRRTGQQRGGTMVSTRENELLTQTDPGTPGGKLLRCYWQPVALSEELPAEGAPLPVRIMGEDLVLFRNESGDPGLLGLHCAHRGADLSYGRLENGGLRCIYHGWLYDVHGTCLEQPGEPSNSWAHSGGRDSMQSSTLEAQTAERSRPFHERIHHTSYPCQEVGGLVLAFMGTGDPPLLPDYEFLTAPDSHQWVTKTHQECNYLQGNEGNIDPVHLSFLHRIFTPESDAAFTANDTCPTLETEETDFGVRIYAVRKVGVDRQYVRVTNFMMPNLAAVPGGRNGYNANWHVPIDDTHHWRYDVRLTLGRPLNPEEILRGRAETDPPYHMIRTKANRYLQDREEMKTKTFLGMGHAFQAHDKCAIEGPGPIQDRTQERLGYTDRGIVAARKMLLQALRDVQEGRDPPHVLRESPAVPSLVVRAQIIPAGTGWRRFWEREDASLDPRCSSDRSTMGQIASCTA